MAVIKILVVDDSQTVLLAQRSLLVRSGYEVITASSAGEGVELALREQPALALVDADMPRVSGLEACRRLAEDPATAGIPVVLLVPPTVPAPPTEAATWRAVLGKPLLEHALLAAVRAHARGPVRA